jgi:hypothetical protein
MKLRRVGALAAAGLLFTAFAGAASADTPEAYVGSAAGRALNIDVKAANLQATLGATTASISSTLVANAKATGALTPLGENTVEANATKAAPVASKPEVCATPAIPAPASDVVGLAAACAQASSSVANGLPIASSEAAVGKLELKANTILSTLPIGDLLAGVFDPLTDTGTALDPVTTTVEDLVTSVLNTKTLDAQFGVSTSKVETDADAITSTATADGGVIRILPTPSLSLAPEYSNIPVATIKVSSSSAQAVYNRASGTTAEPTWDAALVTVELSPALGLPVNTIKIAPNQTQTILQGTPLESTITVADGHEVTNADGTKGAVADGVKLELLKGVSGGLVLELAHSEAGVNGEPAAVVKGCVALPGQSTCQELPREEHPMTGGTPVLPMAAALMMAAAFITRRVVVSAR